MSTLFSRRLFLLTMLLFITAGLLVACGNPFNSGSSNNTATASPTANDETNPTPIGIQQEFHVGSPAVVEQKFIITVKNPKMSSGDSSIKPQNANDQFLIFSVSIKNISKQEQNVPDAALFRLADSSGKKYDLVSDPGAGPALQGTISAGGLFHGVLVYETPSSMHTFTVSFQLAGKNQQVTIWDVKV